MAVAGEETYLPERPQEPLPSDCCGTGCTPCVMDLYSEELAAWERLRAMSVDERRRLVESKANVSDAMSSALSPVEYKHFELINVEQITRDSFLYSFKLLENQILGVGAGQHAVLRSGAYSTVTPQPHVIALICLVAVQNQGHLWLLYHTPVHSSKPSKPSGII